MMHGNDADSIVLYHGTSAASAALLLADGWAPRSGAIGSQCGNPGLLYLTTTPENASWYADEKADGTVITVTISRAALIVDPEDGTGDSVEEEMNSAHGLPGNLATGSVLEAKAFAAYQPAHTPAI